MTENEFILADRIAKIKSTIEKYGEENFFVAFSGGKDSTVLSALVDMAVPGNKIPRVFANTGIEYRLILEFVKKEKAREHLWELIELKPKVNIKKSLDENGYPLKSKAHAKKAGTYQRHGMTASAIHYLNPANPNARFKCPKILRYQFTPDFKLKVDSSCCIHMKEKPVAQWSKENKRPIEIVGIMHLRVALGQTANAWHSTEIN